MKCYSHFNKEAVGMCKSCNKGICVDCSIDTGFGLACQGSCEQEVSEIHELVERNKQIYSIGTKAPLIPSGAMVYLFFTLMFYGWAVFRYINLGFIDIFALIMGTGFCLIGVYVIYKNRKLKLNC